MIKNQNENLSSILAEQTVSVQSIIKSYWQTPKYVLLFPIKSDDELLVWENKIEDENKQDMVK